METVIDCVAKGIEIRTTIHSTIQGAIDELTASFILLSDVAANFGFSPVLASFNPYTSVFKPQPPLNDFEITHRFNCVAIVSVIVTLHHRAQPSKLQCVFIPKLIKCL